MPVEIIPPHPGIIERQTRVRIAVAESIHQNGIIPTIERSIRSYNPHDHHYGDDKHEAAQMNLFAAQEAIAHGLGGTLDERRKAVEGIFTLIESRQNAEEYRRSAP